MADIDRLHAEIAELKQLVLGLLTQQNTQQLHPTALNVLKQQQIPPRLAEILEQQRVSAHATASATNSASPCAEQHVPALQSSCSNTGTGPGEWQLHSMQHSDMQTQRPKPSVQLELPCDECAAASTQQDLQQHDPVPVALMTPVAAPVMITSKLLKPSISDVVMHLRAAQQVGSASAAGLCMNGLDVSQSGHLSLPPAAPLQLEQPQLRKQATSSLSVRTQPQHQAQQQLLQTRTDATECWSIGAGYGNETKSQGTPSCPGSDYNDIDLLSKRVHSDVISRECSKQWQEDSIQLVHRQKWLATATKAAYSMLKAFWWDVLVPQSSVLVLWDSMMLLLIIYMCFVLPYAVAFAIDFADIRQPLGAIDLTINLIFLVDVWVNFHTSYISDGGRLITDRRLIAQHYLKGWFTFDVLSSIPYEQMLGLGGGAPALTNLLQVARIIRILKVLRLIKLLRLARVMRLPHILQRLEAVIGRVLLQLFTMAGSMILLLHWAACIWYYVAVVSGDNNSWVMHDNMKDASFDEIYITALYWSVTTIATVGYGDIVGHSIPEKVVAMIAMLIGASVFAYFMGAMAVVVSALNSSNARMATKRQAVDEFLRHRRVPRLLSEMVKNYYNYVVAREVQADEADIIAGLSASLRTQVVLHLYQEALEKVPFFRGQDPQFITSVVTFLKLEYYAPGDIVVRQGDLGSEMYFIGEGVLEARIYEDDKGSPLSKATYVRSMTRHQSQLDKRRKKSAAGTHSRQPSGPAVAGKAQQQLPEESAGGGCDSSTSTGADCSPVGWPASLHQAADAAVRVARRSWLGKAILHPCSSDSPASDLQLQQVSSSGCKGDRGSEFEDNRSVHRTSTNCKGHHEVEKANSPAYGQEYPLLMPGRKLLDKYTYVDELGSRKFRRIGYLRAGEYFGEFSCLLGEARTATVVATTYCELYSLSRADLEEVLQQWPELAEEFEAMVHDASAPRQPTPPPRGTAAGPLAMWNVVKAAYQQSALGRGKSSVDSGASQYGAHVVATIASPKQPPGQRSQQQQQEQTVIEADVVEAAAVTAQAVMAADAQVGVLNAGPAEPEATGLQESLRGLHSSSSKDFESYPCQSSMSGSPKHAAVQRGGSFRSHKGTLGQRLCEPRPTLGRRLSNASAFAASAGSSFSDGGASELEATSVMSVAARTAASIKRSLQLSHNQQQSLQQDRLSAVEGQQDSSLTTEPSLATRSINLARNSQQGLSKRSVSAGLGRTSLSRKSPVDLRRPSFIPGVGTGLFQSNNGGYLFPLGVDRNGALVPQGHGSTAAATTTAALASDDAAGEGMLGAAASRVMSNQPSLRVCSNKLFDVYETDLYQERCSDASELDVGLENHSAMEVDKQLEGFSAGLGNTTHPEGHEH